MELATGITSTPWLVIAMILLAGGCVTMFFPRIPTCLVTYLAMWCARLSGYTPFPNSTMIFWGIAVVLVVINRYMLPNHIRDSRRGLGYIAGGALAGMAIGLTLYTAASIIGGAILGTLIGAVAYARTSRGAVLEFPTIKFFNYLGAKGIPSVMTASMAGLIIAGLVIRSL